METAIQDLPQHKGSDKMKGYSPNLTNKEKTKEISSKIKQEFIELGTVNTTQNEDIYLEKYIKIKIDN